MSDEDIASGLHAAAPLVAPSLLACDFAHLAEEIRRLEEAGARMLHLDVMDGHFVPNLGIGVPVVEAIRRVTRLPLDVHLMISEPARYVEAFRRAGADLMTIHIEAVARAAAAAAEDSPTGGVGGDQPQSAHPDRRRRGVPRRVRPGAGDERHARLWRAKFDPAALEKLRRLREAAARGSCSPVDGGLR